MYRILAYGFVGMTGFLVLLLAWFWWQENRAAARRRNLRGAKLSRLCCCAGGTRWLGRSLDLAGFCDCQSLWPFAARSFCYEAVRNAYLVFRAGLQLHGTPHCLARSRGAVHSNTVVLCQQGKPKPGLSAAEPGRQSADASGRWTPADRGRGHPVLSRQTLPSRSVAAHR